MKITCRSCGSHGPFTAGRHIAQIRDVVDGEGEETPWTEWDFANETRVKWLQCGSCGHSWTTSRSFE